MAQDKLRNATVRLSVLDRLIDDNPEITREATVPLNRLIRSAVEAVRRDLQALLNCRQVWVDEALLECDEASRSIAVFGLPDLIGETIDGSAGIVQRLQREIENAILIFEPRLTRVEVTPEPRKPNERNIRFRIDAVLWVDPVEEPVTFDTVVKAGGETQVLSV